MGCCVRVSDAGPKPEAAIEMVAVAMPDPVRDQEKMDRTARRTELAKKYRRPQSEAPATSTPAVV